MENYLNAVNNTPVTFGEITAIILWIIFCTVFSWSKFTDRENIENYKLSLGVLLLVLSSVFMGLPFMGVFVIIGGAVVFSSKDFKFVKSVENKFWQYGLKGLLAFTGLSGIFIYLMAIETWSALAYIVASIFWYPFLVDGGMNIFSDRERTGKVNLKLLFKQGEDNMMNISYRLSLLLVGIIHYIISVLV